MRRNVLVNTIYTGGTFLIGVIIILLSSFIVALDDAISTALMFGIIFPLLSCFSWSRIIEEYNFRKEKFFKVLFWIGGILGLICLLLPTLAGLGTWETSFKPTMDGSIRYDGALMLYFSLGTWLALLINAILRNFPSLFPTLRDKWPRLFFEDYGFMILLPLCIGVVAILSTFLMHVSFYFTILLVWNLVVIFFFIFFKMRYQKVFLGYIVIGLTALINLVVLLLLFNSSEMFPADTKLFINADFTYCVAACSFFLLALIICGPFYVILEKIDNKLSRNVQSIIFFVVPLISFGLQFLVFEYWWVALIAVVVILGILFLIALFAPPSFRDYVYIDDDGDYYVVRKYY